MLLIGRMLLTSHLQPLFGIQFGEEGVGLGGYVIHKGEMHALGQSERLLVELATT